MRNELLGYLLGALETDEREHVESELAKNDQLQREMELLRSGLVPLETDGERIEPPLGLAQRTIDFVFLSVALKAQGPSADEPAVNRPQPNWSDHPAPPRRWRMVDMSVAAGILVAALSVVVPAIIQSRANAERLACQNRMQQTYAGIAQYAGLHNGALPIAKASDGFEGKAGIYAPLLRQAGLLNDQTQVVCPGSELATELADEDYRLPSIEELRKASGPELKRLIQRMGGSYAFAIGYRENGKYRSLVLRPGANFPLMADVPGKDGKPVGHHGACGRNVLTADGRTVYIHTCQWGARDNLFANDDGEIDAGNSKYDNVLMWSDRGPIVRE